eukprot:403369704
MMQILWGLLYLFLGYIIFENVIMMYYRYWWYLKQGYNSTGFPVPIFGNLRKILKSIKNRNEYSQPIFTQYLTECFNGNVPPMVVDFRSSSGILFISDPEIVQELYMGKQKYFDKYYRTGYLFKTLFGESLLFEKSTERQALKRKHLSVAFYKERMSHILNTIIQMTKERVDQLKVDIKAGKNELNLVDFINTLTMRSIQVCVFGISDFEQDPTYLDNQKETKIPLGPYLKKLFMVYARRNAHFLRMISRLFDQTFIGLSEKELQQNCFAFRDYLRHQIKLRKEQIKDPLFQSKDFLTLLVTDDLFKDDESLIVDECCTFLFAATQTTASTVSNALFYLTQNTQIRDSLRKEIASQFKDLLYPSEITVDKWQQKLNYDNLQNQWTYLMQIVQESLRIEPPVRISSGLMLTETQKIQGYIIPKNKPFLIFINNLHRNPKEWQEPEKFIPERFDPESIFYLTPDGKKRNPSSFGPFLGGRRICLGKTLAENLAKIMIPIIVSEIDFDFINPEHKFKKPPQDVTTEPKFGMIAKINNKL